ncbi:MAG: ATP-dependent zinc metalloprotease FtsH [Armatimonadetes bacterium]|nr:ATP-dependent zinc metalloprotease FtsH [Armatimonadota bacterium]
MGGFVLGNRFFRSALWVIFIVLVASWLMKGSVSRWVEPTEPMQYSDLLKKIENGEINKGTFEKDRFRGETTNGDKFTVNIPESQEEKSKLTQLLYKHGVSFGVQSTFFTELWQSLLFSLLLPLFLLTLFWIFFLRQAQSGGNQALSFGRSRAKRANESIPKITFEDVAGIDEAKQELQEVVEFLKNPKKFQALGAKIPKGVLLVGPPGSGKTLLARAIAGEAGVPFFHISGSDFVEMFVGVGASRVRDLFDTAKASAPSLVFIDEIDAVGRQRGAGLGGGHDEREQTLNQLLVEMDGFDPNKGVILIAATNRPDILDPALLRPGRFDRRITVDNPDANGRKAILHIHTRGKPLTDEINLENLARRTPGFSGADLANLVNEAALLAAREEKTKIDMDDFNAAIDRVVAGPERKSRIISEKEKVMVAYHELGHAIVAHVLPNTDPVHKVSILPRGMALGYTMTLPTQDRYLVSKSYLMDEVTQLLGGRVAEQLVFGEMTTGASNDLERSSEIARSMVCELGMSEKLGPLTLGRRHGSPFLGRDLMEDRNFSEQIASVIDEEVRKIIDDCYEQAEKVLLDNREKMDEIVQVLLEKESIEQAEFEALMAGSKLPDPVPDNAPPPPPAQPAETKPRPEPLPTLHPKVEPA